MSDKEKTWETTREANLLRNSSSGRFYGRFIISGKSKWINLKTDVFTVAKLRLADERAKVERMRQSAAKVGTGAATMGELADLFVRQIEGRVDLTPKTRTRYRELVKSIRATWPRFDSLDPADVTREAVTKWRNKVAHDGTGFRPPGAKGKTRFNGGASATINKRIDALRGILTLAVDRGQLTAHALHGRGIKMRQATHKPRLPEGAVIAKLFEEIESGAGIQGKEIADFCRFLAYTGCRLAEAGAVTWADVDLGRGILHVRGTKTAAAAREVPLNPPARALLQKIYERRRTNATVAIDGVPSVDPTARVLAVREATKSLARACRALGVEGLTHHDLRDAFATTCIEAGVDIPTVAAWLGHADGGALLMRVYAHHRRAHSLAQASKVNFGS